MTRGWSMIMSEDEGGEKRVIGLYGEMRLAMELHQRKWQVYRAYIDDKFDFVIMKCYCDRCKDFTTSLRRKAEYRGRNTNVVTNLCEKCGADSIRMLVRFIQVKTSEGVDKGNPAERTYSFHPKIRYHLADGRVFYVWIQVWNKDKVNYYIFKTEDVEKFDNISLDTYQMTDNQKTNLRIDPDGKVLTRSKYNTAEVFQEFLNNFDVFDELIEGDDEWKWI